MANAIKNYDSIDPSNETQAFKTDFPQSHTHSKVSGLVDPIFKKIKDLSLRYLGSPTYLIASQEDTITRKTLKIVGWIFGISPTILITAYLYNALLDFYHQRFQKYSKLEECLDEEPINPEPLEVNLSQESPSEDMPKIPENTLQDETASISPMERPKELHNETIIEDIPETIAQEEPESNSSNTPEKKIEMPQESSAETSDSSKTLNNQEELERESDESSFEIINMSPELQEAPIIISRSTSLWERIKNFKLFHLKTWDVVIPSDSTIHENIQEPSYKDFEMLDPIIVDHKETQIETTKKILIQLKKDLPRNDIFINNKKYNSLQEFIDYFGIHLDENKTDILPGYHPLIPKIFDYSTQTSLNFGFQKFLEHNMDKLFNPLMAVSSEKGMQFHIKPTSHISWNPESPEQAEIIAESSIILFNPSESTASSNKPLATYKLIVKTNVHQTEVSWQLIEKKNPNEPLIELQEAELESSFVIVDPPTTEETEQPDDDNFEVVDELPTDASNSNNNFKIAYDHLLNKTSSCLTSTVTSEYLNSLKVKHSHFVFDDRLMFPVSITTDKIAKFLNDLKINNSNQLIFLPFLVNGRSVDHAVVAVINLSDETIEYFDPKGQSSILPTRTEKQSKKNVFDFLTELGQKVISSTFSKDKILYNKKNIPQGFTDGINCGVFCLQFIEERITYPFDAIENGIIGRIKNPRQLRLQLANNLKDRSSGSTQDSFEFIGTSDVANMPSSPAPTTPANHFPPIFFSPNNPFHLEKYSHLLRTIREILIECSSDTNLDELRSIISQENLDSREKYRQYVDTIRKLLGDTTLESNTRKNLERVCFAEFTTNVMTDFIGQFLREATNNTLKSPFELSMHTIADAMTTTNNELKNSPSKKELVALGTQKVAGELGLNFDPTKYSNIPEVRSIHTVKSPTNGSYEIIYMRHGTPTAETGTINPAQDTDNFLTYYVRQAAAAILGSYNATTVPEYSAFLNRARDLNQPVFYVNHQKMIDETSAEYGRSRAIQNNETIHPKHFFFMTLPLDGVVLNYVQNTDQWKKELIDGLMREKNGFRLPNRLKDDFAKDKGALEKQFKDLLNQLHNLYFMSKPLSHTDQRTLLMIFYSYLKDFVKDRYQIQIMVSACKDNKDRGNATASVDEAIYNLRLGREDDSQALYDLYIRALAPFIIKYEHIVPKRLELLTNVLQHISTLTDIQKEAIRQFQVNEFKILDQRVPL